MKEIFGMILVLVFLVTDATACSWTDDQDSIQEELVDKQAYVDGLTNQIDDGDFWNSANTAVNLVQDSIETKYPVSVSFRLEINDSDRIVTEPVEVSLDADSRVGRGLVAANLLMDLVDPEILDMYGSGNTARVTGVLINWSKRKAWWSKETQEFSACDLDVDGIWDYACAKSTSFSGVPHVLTPEFELTDVEISDLAPVDKAASLSDLSRIAR